jgi:glutathione S-transferase
MLKLYGHANRTAANILKIRAALYEVGAGFEYAIVDLANGAQKKPEYLAINPHGKVPVLTDGDFVLPESDAILWYVAEKHPKSGLLPTDAQGRARVLEWCDFASSGLYTWSYEHHTHTTYAELANRSVWVAEKSRAALDRALGVLEQRLGPRQFVATDTLTIADFGLTAVIHMVRTRSQIEAGAYPNVAAYYERMVARPAWVKALTETP